MPPSLGHLPSHSAHYNNTQTYALLYIHNYTYMYLHQRKYNNFFDAEGVCRAKRQNSVNPGVGNRQHDVKPGVGKRQKACERDLPCELPLPLTTIVLS